MKVDPTPAHKLHVDEGLCESLKVRSREKPLLLLKACGALETEKR